MSDPVRKLRVQVGVVKRSLADIRAFREELASDKKRLSALESDDAVEEGKLLQQRAVVQESEVMVTHALEKLPKAIDALEAAADVAEDAGADSALVEDARELIERARAAD